jgi:O-succinylbenzoate synthase
LKWKVGVDDEDSEIAVLRKIADALPTGVMLRLDANGAWDRGTARAWIDACDGLPVEFIEQPFPRGDDAALLEIGTAYPWLIALDESVTPPGELWRWLEAEWPGVVEVKPSHAGDPVQLRKLLTESKADAVFSTALETTVGWHAALRFALGHTGARRALGFGAGNILSDDLLNPPEATPVASAKQLAPAPDPWTHLSR